MTIAFAWAAMLAPLALLLASFAKPRAVPQGGMIALGIAIIAAFAAAWFGPLSSPTLGAHGLGLSIRLDSLSATLFLLVAFVGAVVLRYSVNYLDGDAQHARFMRLIALTLAAVLTLIVSGNMVQLLFAWVATSLGLHKLLLFYAERPNAHLAARKKFVASRLGDLCLIGAMVIFYKGAGTLDIVSLGEVARAGTHMTGAAVLLAVAALLKSAQLPSHGWLTEVMETPTPVSALLHAGIINAGGFLILRFADVIALSGGSLMLLMIVGGVTALVASVVMLAQASVKVSLAWSTIAQMGFMLLQCGLGAFSAALVHIVGHSLYKAHAFLSSGSVIDIARASWSPSPTGKPHPFRVGLAIATVLGTAAAVASLAGVTIEARPCVWALAAILLLGLVQLVANAFDEQMRIGILARIAGLGAVVAATYFAVQFAAERLTAGTLPSGTVMGAGETVLAIAIVTAFALVTFAQNTLGAISDRPRLLGAYTHVANGFYLNTWANRAITRVWPLPKGVQA